MVGPLPHSAQITELAATFLGEVATEISSARATLSKSAEFTKIYRVSLATDAVLSELLQSSIRPQPHATLAIVKGVPLLVSARQMGSAKIELRRFMELIMWDIYFEEHPVEWERFSAKPSHGYTRDEKDPIEYCAHRELDYYLNYAKSRVSDEPSRLSVKAAEDLKALKGRLNQSVHPGVAVHMAGHAVPLDQIEKKDLQEFNDLQRSVFKNTCLLLAALRRKKFDVLPPMHRAHFDWLMGVQLAKKIRSGAFGI